MSGQNTLRRGAVLVATLFGTGRAPLAPGTFGTLAAALPAGLLARRGPPWAFALATIILAIVAIWTSDVAARSMGMKDPRPVVIDEAAGFFVALLYVPVGGAGGLVTILAAFVLFRVMDVLKPPPARQAEKLPGGWGIVVDDLIAGAYANVILRLLALLQVSWIGA